MNIDIDFLWKAAVGLVAFVLAFGKLQANDKKQEDDLTKHKQDTRQNFDLIFAELKDDRKMDFDRYEKTNDKMEEIRDSIRTIHVDMFKPRDK